MINLVTNSVKNFHHNNRCHYEKLNLKKVLISGVFIKKNYIIILGIQKECNFFRISELFKWIEVYIRDI